MQANSIMRRLEALEEADVESNNTHRIVLLEKWGDDPNSKEGSSYIISQCEASCDSETYESALGDAFIAIRGENPLLKKGIVIIHIDTDIAMQVVKILTSQGIVVAL